MEACYGGTDVMERSCAVARGIDINIFKPLLDPGGGFSFRSETAVTYGTVTALGVKRLQIYNGYM